MVIARTLERWVHHRARCRVGQVGHQVACLAAVIGRVNAVTADQHIVPSATHQGVVAIAAVQGVVTRPAQEHVALRVARQTVVARATLHVLKTAEGIVTTQSVRCSARCQIHHHCLRRCVGAVVDGVDSRATLQTVITRATSNCVVTRSRIHRVVARCANHRLRGTHRASNRVHLERLARCHRQRQRNRHRCLHQHRVRGGNCNIRMRQGVGGVTIGRCTRRPVALQEQLVGRIAFDRHRRAQPTRAFKGLCRQRQLCAQAASHVQLFNTRQRGSTGHVRRSQLRHVQHVRARPAVHRQILRVVHDAIVARARVNHIRTRTTIDHVVARARTRGVAAAIYDVAARPTHQGVVARHTLERVVSNTTIQEVVVRSTVQHIRAKPTQQGVVTITTTQGVVTETTIQQVCSSTTSHRVPTRTTHQGVVARTTRQDVVALPTRELRCRVAARDGVIATTATKRVHWRAIGGPLGQGHTAVDLQCHCVITHHLGVNVVDDAVNALFSPRINPRIF